MQTILYKNPNKSATFLILSFAILSTFYNAFLPLHGDEAYYWMWSKHLQMGYYDHPPMIAYLITLSNLVSQSEWGVRLVNVFCMSLSALYIFKLTKELSDARTALNALIIFCSVALTNAGTIITTPDSPLSLFWSLSLYTTYRAIFIGERKDFVWSGIFLGLMILSKYTAVLYIIGVVLFLVLKRRDLFLNPFLYVSIFISLLIASPMIVWNYQHEWISFLFQLHHGASEDGTLYPNLFFEFLGGQFGIFSPIFTAVLFYMLFKEKLFLKDERLFFIALSIMITLLFFFYKSFYSRMMLNYTAPAYIGGTILLALCLAKYELKKTFFWGVVTALLLTLIARIAFLFYLPLVQERMYGNKEAVQLLANYAQKKDRFYGDHLTTAAYLKYYLPNHPDSDVIVPTRFSQYDMWRKKDFLANGLFLARDESSFAYLKTVYKDVKIVATLNVKNGLHTTKTFYIYRLTNPKVR